MDTMAQKELLLSRGQRMLKLALSKIDRLSADRENCAPGCQTEITPYDQCSGQPLQSSGPININFDAVHVPDPRSLV